MKNKIAVLIVFVVMLSSFIAPKKSNSDILNDNRIMTFSKQSSLEGIYKRTKWGLYTAFEFKEKSTVIIHSLGLEFAGSYKQDGKLIRIEDGKSGILLLEIKDKSTLIGQGVAKGTYKK